MTELAEVALAFCEECLAWERPTLDHNYWVTGESQGKHQLICAAHLGDVSATVRDWCDTHNFTFSLSYVQNGNYLAQVHDYSLPYPDMASGKSPVKALMQACLSAHRKMKEGGHAS